MRVLTMDRAYRVTLATTDHQRKLLLQAATLLLQYGTPQHARTPDEWDLILLNHDDLKGQIQRTENRVIVPASGFLALS